VIRTFDGKTPKVAQSAFVSESAYVVGDVEIGEHSSVWPGAVIRGDVGKIVIGKYTAVEDNCVIHSGSLSSPIGDVTIGDEVTIGHGAVINGLRIGNQVLIGMNAIVLHDAEIGNCCIIAAGCLVSQGMHVPDGSFVVGMPGKIREGKSPDKSIWLNGASQGYAELARRFETQGL